MKSPSKKSNDKNLGSLLKIRRLDTGYTQIEIGKKLGVHSMFVSNMENNKCSIPLKHLRKLIKIYDLDRSEVIHFILKKETKRLFKGLK